MNFNRVAEFYKRAIDDHRFSEDFLDEAKSISSEDELRDFFKEKVLLIAKSMGYDFTADDLISYEREVVRELSEEELESVAGGASIKGISTALMSLLMLSGNIQPMSSAMLSKKDILESVNRLVVKGSSQGSSAIDVFGEESRGTGTSAGTVGELVGIDRSDIVDSVEPCKSTSSGYVLRALNLLDPYALKMTGVTSDMRFFDGYTENLKVQGTVEEGEIPERKYNEDQGKGSPNYMRTLFQSSAGELSTAGGSENFARLTADCNPSPELIARIAAFFYNFRNAIDKGTLTNKLNQCEKTLETASKSTDEKLAQRLYDVLKEYQEARNLYDTAVKDESDTTVHKSMTVGQYLNSRGTVDYTISDDLLGKIKLAFFKIHSSESECIAVKEKIKLPEKYKKLDDFIETFKYDQVDGEVLSELKKLDTETVLNDMKEAMRDKDKIKLYKSVIDLLTSELQKSGPKKTIEFDTYVSAKFKKNKDAICAIDKEAQSKYKDLLAKMQYDSKDDASKKADVAKAIKENHALLEGLKTEKEEKDLQEVYKFFEANNMSMDVSKESLRTDSGVKKAKAIISVLKEGTHMIRYQEADDDKGTTEKYPKYTTERMLMSYFIEQFNESSDVDKFYDEIDKLIKSGEKSDDTTIKDRLDIISKVIKEMPTNKNLPLSYVGVDLIENGSTKKISVPTLNEESKEEVSFSGNFADCVDTAVRHFLNLLFYCPGGKWVPEVVNVELESAKEAVAAAINDGSKNVEFRSLKDRVQMFFTHQTPDKVNDGSELTRSLWNYVVSNMDKEEVEDEGFYRIRYVRGKNYELETGFINMLKLIYNIEKALYDSDATKLKVLEEVHAAIESLCDKKKIGNLKSAFESVIHVVKPGLTIELALGKDENDEDDEDDDLDGKDRQEQEIYGTMKVKLKISDDAKDNICFKIYQGKGHACLDLSKSEQKALDIDLGEFENDPIINFFVKRVFADAYKYSNTDSFYELLKSLDGDQDAAGLANSHMLRLIKASEGEGEENYERLYDLCKSYFSAKSSLSMGQINLFDLFQDLYRNSTLRHFGLKGAKFKDAKKSTDGNYKYIEREDGIIEICPTGNLKNEEKITIPVGIGKPGANNYIISPGAFVGFTNLKEIAFEDGVESVMIGDFAFSAGNVEKVNIPSSVQTFKVGVGVFYDAKKFVELNISDKVSEVEISKVKFADNKLDNIVMPEGVEEYSISGFVFSGLKLPDTVTISGDKVETLSVEAYAFKGSSVKNLIVKDAAKKIILKSNSFEESAIDKLNMSEGLQSLIVEDGALNDSQLENIVIPSSVEELRLSDYSRFAVSKGGKLDLGPNVRKLIVGYNVCNNIAGEELAIPDNITDLTLDRKAFAIRGIKKLQLKEGLKRFIVEDRALSYSELKNIVIPSSVEELRLSDYSKFEASKSGKIEIGANVKKLTIGEGVFDVIAKEDESITIDHKLDELTLVGDAFSGTKAKMLTISNVVSHVKLLDKYIFSRSEFGTVNLQGVEEVTINDYAFFRSKVKTLNLGSNLKKINVNPTVFRRVKINSDNPIDTLDLIVHDAAEEWRLYSKSFVGVKANTLKIPDSVKTLTIDGNTFVGSKIQSIDLNKVERLILDSNAFEGFKGKELTIPAGVKELTLSAGMFSESEIETLNLQGVEKLIVESNAFEESVVSKLKFDKLNSLTLKRDAFKRFEGKELTIPAGVKELKINDSAFSRSQVKTLNIETKLQTKNIADDAFKFSNLTKIIVYDEESRDLLVSNKSAYGIGETVEIELRVDLTLARGYDNLNRLSENAELKIPKTVCGLTIKENTFLESGILKLDLCKVERLTLEEGAFSGFIGTELKIPETVQKLMIGKNAFANSEVTLLDINSKLQAENIADGAFTSSNLERIIVYDEESKKLLEDKPKYGISGTVVIELRDNLTLDSGNSSLTESLFDDTKLKIPETVYGLTIEEYVFSGLNISSWDLGKVKRLRLKSKALSGFKGTELKISQTVEELVIDREAFLWCSVKTLNIETKLQAENIENGAFTKRLERIIVHDKESKELLEKHREAYGISAVTIIEQSVDLTLASGADSLTEFLKGAVLVIPPNINELTIKENAFLDRGISKLDLGKVERLTLEEGAFSGFIGTELKIPETVKGFTIGKNMFLESGVLNLDLGKVERLTLKEGAFAGFIGTELKIPETVRNLTIGKNAFANSEVTLLDINSELQTKNIADGAFTSSNLERIIVYDEESKKLLEGNRSKYGISERVVVELNLTLYYGFGDSDSLIFIGETGFEISETVCGLTIEEKTFSESEILNLSLGKVKRLTLKEGAFDGFEGTELEIPETAKELTIGRNAFEGGSIQTLDIESKLEADKISEYAFSSGTLKKIIVHDEDSRKLLEDNRLKYGISDEVKIELAVSPQA